MHAEPSDNETTSLSDWIPLNILLSRPSAAGIAVAELAMTGKHYGHGPVSCICF